MNLHYQYYWFKEVIPHDMCDKIIQMGNKKIEQIKKNAGGEQLGPGALRAAQGLRAARVRHRLLLVRRAEGRHVQRAHRSLPGPNLNNAMNFLSTFCQFFVKFQQNLLHPR